MIKLSLTSKMQKLLKSVINCVYPRCIKTFRPMLAIVKRIFAIKGKLGKL